MKVDRNPMTSGHRGVKRTLSFCNPTSLVFPITRELQSTANLYMVCCRFQGLFLRGLPSTYSQNFGSAAALIGRGTDTTASEPFCLFFTSHPPRSSFESSPYHARETFASFYTCLSSNLLTATFFFIYDKYKSRRHTVPTALPHSTRSVTDMINPL